MIRAALALVLALGLALGCAGLVGSAWDPHVEARENEAGTLLAFELADGTPVELTVTAETLRDPDALEEALRVAIVEAARAAGRSTGQPLLGELAAALAAAVVTWLAMRRKPPQPPQPPGVQSGV